MTITRLRVTSVATDAYGDPQTTIETRVVLDGAFTAPRESVGLDAGGRSGVIVGLSLFLPYGTDLEYSDRVDVDGVVYEIEGEPGSWLHPWTGWQAGMVAALKRGEG